MSSDLTRRSDQFDIRLNIQDDEHVKRIINNLNGLYSIGNIRYMHCSNVEIGDVENRTSFNCKHVHIAIILNNYTTKASILRKVLVQPKLSWYCEPRDKEKSLDGWIQYHSKTRTKIYPDQETLLLQLGQLPAGRKRKTFTEKLEEMDAKKKAKYEDWKRKKILMLTGDWETLDMEFPGFIYSSMGQSMKREIMKQSNDEFTKPITGKLQNFIIRHDRDWEILWSGLVLSYPSQY